MQMTTEGLKSGELTKQIPFLNLKALFHEHRAEFMQAIENVLENSAFIGGLEVESFESEFSNWIGGKVKSCGCGNGTDAITIAAKSLQCEPGAEAIVPAMTFIATVEAILNAGFTVKLVDVDANTGLLVPQEVEKAITQKTRLIVPVHLFGQMPNMDEIKKIAHKHSLLILEDAAQAHGAEWNGNGVGFYGDIATFSFFPGKNLGAFGDGGAIVSKDHARIDYCSAMGKHGGIKKYEHNFVGACSRLDGIQAAILRVKLKKLSNWTENRRRMATWYREYLGNIKSIQLPLEHPRARHVYHLYVIQTENRLALQEHLKRKGIETGIHYPKAIHELPAFEKEHWGPFPNAEQIAKHCLSLPMCPTLTEESARYIGKVIGAY